jgi:uncharacterized protein (TIGR03435 family)
MKASRLVWSSLLVALVVPSTAGAQREKMTTALAAIGHVVVAQDVPATAKFEVVSIRPVADPSPFFKLSQANERLFHITSRGGLVGRADLRSMIILAYGVEPYERIVATRPDVSRLLEEQFEVRALPPEALSPPAREEVKAMTRHMLSERFGVKVRIDTELVRATVLRVIKPGVLGRGIRPAPDGCSPLPAGARFGVPEFANAYRRYCYVSFFDDRIRGTVTLDEFARAISFQAGRPILNRTDLAGLFAIDVAVAGTTFMRAAHSRLGSPLLGPTGEREAPAFVDALRDQMGLSTGTERQPIRLFVVEQAGPFIEN